MTRSKFNPPWVEVPPPEGSYRSILKWGAPDVFKHPNLRLYETMKAALGMSDSDFQNRLDHGEDPVILGQPSHLDSETLSILKTLVGEENVDTSDYSRASHAFGNAMLDLMRLRNGMIENPPDAIVFPRSAQDVRNVIEYCNQERIPIVTYSGGSSVTRGLECMQGGISLDMRKHMKRILAVNPINQTVTVEPGIYGPDLEQALNDAPKRFGTRHSYTCGHFPQSFEFSTVGGWVATRGAGQNSTYYGKIEDLVLSQKYVTPAGDIATLDIPAKAIGPDIDQILIGSEGIFGILVEVTLKIFRYQPEQRHRFSFVFRDWDSSLEACREIMQGEFGYPSVFRLSDPEETSVAFKLYGIEDTPLEGYLGILGYHPQERCLLLGHTDGDRDFGRLVHHKIRRICKQYNALYATGYVTKKWEHGRFLDPYLRDDLGDFGVVIDTLECGVNWENIRRVRNEVHNYCHSRPKTICMAHASHFYPQGANLYFIFITKMREIKEYQEYQAGFLDCIRASGATLSHHHGIGKMMAPWLEGQLGEPSMNALRALKRYFDPHNIMNPGGTLGLDLPPDQKR